MSRARAILLVEDNPDDVELTLRAFKKHNLVNSIVIVRDGKEALDYLFAMDVQSGRDAALMPELVLLDLKLPKIDGLEVLKRLRSDERTRRLPIVIFTSSKEEIDVVRSYDLGANSFVQKPVDFAQFMEAVRNLGLYWLVLNEAPPPVQERDA